MTKYTMTQAAAKRIAYHLIGTPGSFTPRLLDTSAWQKALAAEEFHGTTASNARNVLRELRNADLDATAASLERMSFDALMSEAMDLRIAATSLVNAFGALGKARL